MLMRSKKKTVIIYITHMSRSFHDSVPDCDKMGWLSSCYIHSSCFVSQAHVDHFDLVSRRMGFIPLPLGSLVS